MTTLGARLARCVPQLLRSSADPMWERCMATAPGVLVATQLVSLRGLQHQQSAAFSAYKKPPPEDEDIDAEDLKAASRKGHLPRVAHSALLHRVPPSVEADVRPSAEERQDKIKDLLRTMSGREDAAGAFSFVDEFFAEAPTTTAGGAAGDLEAAAATGDEGDEPSSLSDIQEGELLSELRGLRRGSQRVVLQKLLQGGMLQADPAAMAEWKKIQAAFRPPEGFRMKVVDVNRTCKGTRSGGLYRFSAMVVVGNGDGVLGWGQGKATEVNDAVRKAYSRACSNLYPVPRFNRHTIPEPITSKFGKVKVVMYPKSSGRGIVASTLVTDICKLAGIHDIGVKIHGSRNPRNTVKCVFEAFDGMRTHEEIMESAPKGKMMLAVPPGRFGRLQSN